MIDNYQVTISLVTLSPLNILYSYQKTLITLLPNYCVGFIKPVSLFITIKYTGTTKIKNLALISNVAVVVVCCLLVKPARLDKHRGPSSAGVERVLQGWREY